MPEDVQSEQLQSITFRIVDTNTPGWDLNHPYVETFWLPTIGPTATVLLRFLRRHVRTTSEGIPTGVFEPVEVAFALGVSQHSTKNAPLPRTMGRLVRFGLATWRTPPQDPNPQLDVSSQVPPVPERWRTGWPQHLRILHARAVAHHHLDGAKPNRRAA